MATSKEQNEQRVQPIVLLPCPFCGAEATIAKGIREDYSGACTILSCRAEGPVASTQEQAASKWNERTMLPDDVAMILR